MNRWTAPLLFTLTLCVGLAPAAEPPTTPMLRIEPGMHTARIGRVASDAAGRYLATASNDKTVRVWSAAAGELLSTLQPPAGEGNEGKVYAVAFSPDGGTVAAGGWTMLGSDSGHTIYLFDRASGRLLRRLGGLPNVINELSFSPDGRLLAAAVGGQNGLRVFEASSGRLAGEDRAIGGQVYGLAWHSGPAGLRLAGTSYDGKVRLWAVDATGGTLQKTAEAAAPGGKRPFGIAFSPDGRRLAVGYDDSTIVSLLDAATLSPASPQASADTSGITVGDLSKVAWTDGHGGPVLWAAGRYQKRVDGQWKHLLRRWPLNRDGTLGAHSETPIADDTVMSFAPLPGGRLAFGSAEPAWGLINVDGSTGRVVPRPVRDFRNSRSGALELSADGQMLRIGKLGFDLRAHRLGLPADAKVDAPRATTSVLDVREWKDNATPTLNGQPLKLEQYELSRSLAITADGQGFALGADWSLRRFDAQGREVWKQAAPGAVWAVNLAEQHPGGRTVVAAYSDGTVRWHRWSDGKELLALFAHPDNQRWVLWAPSGTYDASPGGEDLIGFQVNRGKDNAADYFPAARFRASLYRPDVVDRLLATQDEAEAVRVADAEAGRKAGAAGSLAELGNKLPPVLTLLSPESGSTVSAAIVTVKIQVRSAADAPVSALRVRVNGQPVEIDGQRALKPKGAASDSVQTLVVPVPAQDSEVTIFAENRHGTSTAASLKLVWAGKSNAPTAGSEPEFVAKPKLYVLAVGVSNYKQADLRLRFAAKDAKDFVAAVQKQKGKLYRDVVVKLLADEKATRDEVLDGLEWIRREVTQRDVGMVFLAGHGFNDADGVFYYLPVEGDPDRIKRTGVVYSEIKSTLTNLAGKSMFFVDACHSGNVLGDGVRRRGQADMNFIVNELSSAENGVLVFASSTGRQFSLENTAWNNGAFTKALVEGLNGQADYNKNGRITHKMLDLYVSERVKELTKGQQTPKTLVPQGVTDYPVAVVK